MSAGTRVLVIGLDPYRVPGPWDPTPVAEGIERGRAKFVDRGIDARFCLFGLDGSDDVEAVVTAALQEHAWACVVIGGGVRHDGALLERVVNLVHEHASAARIAFNDTPEETLEAALRELSGS